LNPPSHPMPLARRFCFVLTKNLAEAEIRHWMLVQELIFVRESVILSRMKA